MFDDKRFWLKSLIIVGIVIVAAVAFAVFAGGGSSWFSQETHVPPVEPENADWKSFQSPEYQYSFLYPSVLVGGTQIISSGSPTLESVAFQTVPSVVNRLAILSSVEKFPNEIKDGLSVAVLQYEQGLKGANIQFTEEATSHISRDGVDVLEKHYYMMGSSAVTRFAIRNQKLYIFSVLRPSDEAGAAIEKKILDSFHF